MHGENFPSHDMPKVFLSENLATRNIAEAFLGENFAGNDIRDCFPDICNRCDEVGDAAKEMKYPWKVFDNSCVDIFIELPDRLND